VEPAVSMPHTENSLSTKTCQTGAATKSCAISARTEYTFDALNSGARNTAVKCTRAADIRFVSNI